MFNIIAKFALKKLRGSLNKNQNLIRLLIDLLFYALVIVTFALESVRFLIALKAYLNN